MARLQRHQILLHPGDFKRLDELHAHTSATDVIRTLVRRHIEAVERRLRDAPPARTMYPDKETV